MAHVFPPNLIFQSPSFYAQLSFSFFRSRLFGMAWAKKTDQWDRLPRASSSFSQLDAAEDDDDDDVEEVSHPAEEDVVATLGKERKKKEEEFWRLHLSLPLIFTLVVRRHDDDAAAGDNDCFVPCVCV